MQLVPWQWLLIPWLPLAVGGTAGMFVGVVKNLPGRMSLQGFLGLLAKSDKHFAKIC